MSFVKRVAMVIFMERDLDAAISFYSKLGLSTVFNLKDRWAEMLTGNLQIGLCPTSVEFDNIRTGVVFEVENIKELYEALKDEMSFLSEPVEALHGIMVSVKDPSGNIVDLYQPTPEKVKEAAEKAPESAKTSDVA